MDLHEDPDAEDDLTLGEGTYPVHLKQKTREKLQCIEDWDVSDLEPLKIVNLADVRQDVQEFGQDSDFFTLQQHLEKCKMEELLLIYDKRCLYGSQYLLCLNGDSKYSYLQAEEDANMKLVEDMCMEPFEYAPPTPRSWVNLKSDVEIEGDWIKDTRPKIRLQIKRMVARQDEDCPKFSDRDAADAADGYVACESYASDRQFETVRSMEHAMQAVPALVDRSSQTELKHPKNVFTQYEPRVFSEEEVQNLAKSKEMEEFLKKVVDVMNEVSAQPDIMGDLRETIEQFYTRDQVEMVEETQLKEVAFFADVNFSNGMRVTNIRWHERLEGVVAISVAENCVYEAYLDNLTKRLVMPNMLMIWSLAYPLFPQVLLRICDDVVRFEWHPTEDGILVGGCTNGQVLIWDIGEYLTKLQHQICIWNHSVVMEKQTNKLNIQDGCIPVVHWSAESSLQHSHRSQVEDLRWLPQSVWFSTDSAYPKKNQNEGLRQFITCSADNYILVWDMKPPPNEADYEEDRSGAKVKRSAFSGGGGGLSKNWQKLRNQTTTVSVSLDKKWSPAVGRYSHLNKVWKPVHKICFLEGPSAGGPAGVGPASGVSMAQQQSGKGGGDHDPSLKTLLTSLSVTVRPDLMILSRSIGSGKRTTPFAASKAKTTAADQAKARDNISEEGSVTSDDAFEGDGARSAEDDDALSIAVDPSEAPRTGAAAATSVAAVARKALDSLSSDNEDDEESMDPSQQALPTMLMAGTIWGAVLRADLSKNKVDVETNNLMCAIEWITPVHDGPVKVMEKSPTMPHLLLTSGGYSFAVWNEGIMNRPFVLHFVNDEQFTSAAWSLSQPSVVFFSTDMGHLQVWDITKRRSEPFQQQNIAGNPINAISPYVSASNSCRQHFISVADDTGTVRMMLLPRHLCSSSSQATENLQLFVDSEIAKKVEKERLKNDREKQLLQGQGSTMAAAAASKRKKAWEEQVQEETEVSEVPSDFLAFYFSREKIIMERIYGPEWRRHLAHPEWPREEYQLLEEQKSMGSTSSSITSSRKHSIIAQMSAKSKGVTAFLNL